MQEFFLYIFSEKIKYFLCKMLMRDWYKIELQSKEIIMDDFKEKYRQELIFQEIKSNKHTLRKLCGKKRESMD